ncbi:MAG: TonB-dependent receptor [Proteobacteria bacterium]|nr:TonB-dependent receptor [Pseudomonadota bacterium]
MTFQSRNARGLVSAFLPSCLLAGAVAAQAQSVPMLSPVVVTASGTEQKLQDALPATTVITQDEIARAHASDLPTLLDTVAGVQLAQAGGIGSPTSAFLRGGNSNDTLVLIDGVPVNNLTAGTASLEHIALADIDHIEIVRGNVSAIYGSAALGGVIQIFTREAGAKPQISLSGQVGSYGLKQTDASGSVRLASGTSLAASAETLNYKGFPAINASEVPGALSVDDGTTRRALGFSVRQDLGSGNSVGLRLRDSRGTVQYDPEFSPDTQTFMTRFALSGAVLDGLFQLRPNLKLTAALTHSTDKWDDTADHAGYFNSTSDGANAGLQWEFAPQQRLTGGVETTHQSLDSDTLYTTTGRTQNSLRLGYLGKFGDRAQHQLQINLRSDHYSDFGNANTGYLGYAYWLNDNWRVKASYSTGFNAPTFNQLYYPGFSNPNLQPEQLKSGELGLEWAADGQQFRAVLFRNDYTDLIALNSFYVPYNIGRARIDGVEFSYQGRFGATRLHADLTLQDPKNLATGDQLVRRARTLAHLGASHDIGAWTVGGELRYASSSPDTAFNLNTFAVTPATIPAYTVAVLTADYRINPEWTAFARLDNLFNSRYETVYGYNQPGRGIYVGLRWQPKL